MISVIDYGIGNIASIVNMLKKIGVSARLVNTVEDIEASSKLILPGVGSFDAGISRLRSLGFEAAIQNALGKNAYILGICLGMQMLLERSEEGELKGLSLIEGSSQKFDARSFDIKVPHMGWNIVVPSERSVLFDRALPEHRFYFVHSYFVKCKDQNNEIARANYGSKFCCAIQKGRVMGVQFHPEKSHKFGMTLLAKYAELPC